MPLLLAIAVTLVIDEHQRISYLSPSSGVLYGDQVAVGQDVVDALGTGWLTEGDDLRVMAQLAETGHWSGVTLHRVGGTEVPVSVEARIQLDRGANVTGMYLEVRPVGHAGPDATAERHDHEDDRYQMSLDRLERLQAISARLISVGTLRDITNVVCGEAVDGVGAFAASMALLDGTATSLEVLVSCGYPTGAIPRWSRLPLDRHVPATVAARSGEPVWIESVSGGDHGFGDLERLLPDTGSTAALPLRVDEAVLGVLWFSFAQPRQFERDDRNFLLTVAAQCSHALDRVRRSTAPLAADAAARSSVLVLETTDIDHVGLRARRLLHQVIATDIDDALRADLEVVITELVANAARHAGPPLRLTTERRHDYYRLQVDDTSPQLPVQRSPRGSEPGGRGLLLVDAFATRWGVDRQPWGKSVWAELG